MPEGMLQVRRAPPHEVGDWVALSRGIAADHRLAPYPGGNGASRITQGLNALLQHSADARSSACGRS